jgi:hypothetical protein
MNLYRKIYYESGYNIVISQSFTGLCNQLWSIVSGMIICIKENKNVLVIDKFLLNIHTKSYCPISKILSLPSMNIFLAKYKLTLIDGYQIVERNWPNIKELNLEWQVLNEPENKDLKTELFNNIRFTSYIVLPALKFVKDKTDNLKKGTINVIHLRIEQDWLDHVSLHSNPRSSPEVVKGQIASKYIDSIQKYIQKDELTFVLTGSTQNKVIDYLRDHRYTYFLFAKPTSYREVNAAMDMVIGKQCNNVFIGCGGSTFSDMLIYCITGADTKKYLC